MYFDMFSKMQSYDNSSRFFLSAIATTTPVWAASPIVDASINGGSYAVAQDGTPLLWYGTSTPAPVSLGGITGISGDYWLKNDGTIWFSDGTQLQPTLSGVIQVANHDSLLALRNDGTVWEWGNNATRYGTTATQFAGLTNIVSITSSGSNLNEYINYAIKSDGTVYGWGYDKLGLFGISGENNVVNSHFVPALQPALTGFANISLGWCHAVGLKADGTVWAWGDGNYNCFDNLQTTGPLLGNGVNQSATNTPVQVPNLSGIVAVKAGTDHSLALKNDGTLWAWGYNYYGQLGNNSTVTPPTPVQVSGLTNVISFAPGSYGSTGLGFNVAVKSDGSVWTWGSSSNSNGSASTVPIQVIGVNGNGYLYLIPPTTADLALTFSSTPQPEVQPNYGVRYSGAVRNLGAGGASNSKVVITLPASASFLGSASGNCSASGNTVTCLLGTIWQSNSLHPNTDVGFSFEVGMLVAGSYSVTATVSSDLNDPIPGNNAIAFNSPSSTIFSSYSIENMGDDVPTLPEWGMILFATLLLLSHIWHNRKTRI